MTLTYSFNDLMAFEAPDLQAAQRALIAYDYDLNKLPRQVPHLLGALAQVMDQDPEETLPGLLRSLGRNWWWID